MTLLDRYLTRQLLYPIFFCVISLVFLVFMADIFDNLDQMIKNKTPVLLILKYYLALVPETYIATISWASLLGCVYVLTSFNYHNELTAMKIAGLEITSIIRPLIFIGFALGVLSFIINDQVVPRTSQIANVILMEHIEKGELWCTGKQQNNAQGNHAAVFSNFHPADLIDIRITREAAARNIKSTGDAGNNSCSEDDEHEQNKEEAQEHRPGQRSEPRAEPEQRRRGHRRPFHHAEGKDQYRKKEDHV